MIFFDFPFHSWLTGSSNTSSTQSFYTFDIHSCIQSQVRQCPPPNWNKKQSQYCTLNFYLSFVVLEDASENAEFFVHGLFLLVFLWESNIFWKKICQPQPSLDSFQTWWKYDQGNQGFCCMLHNVHDLFWLFPVWVGKYVVTSALKRSTTNHVHLQNRPM